MTGPWEQHQPTDGAASDAADLASEGLPSWAQAPAIVSSARFPALPAQNLTVQALRTKGVLDADIAAAINSPGRMRQLINQTYAAGPAKTPAGIDPALWSGRKPAAPIMMAPLAG
jgi:hypothetical protein